MVKKRVPAIVPIMVALALWAGCTPKHLPSGQETEMEAIHSFTINGLPVRTGDLICTQDGGDSILPGQVWRLIGKIIPGEVDHIVIYVGPGGKCVEAGARGVTTFEIKSNVWDAGQLRERYIADRIYGVAYPLEGRGLNRQREDAIRKSVASYCLEQAALRKPYNANFFNPSTEEAFYCSQLAYKAYLHHGIDFNKGRGNPDFPGTDIIIFPQEVWESSTHRCAEPAPANCRPQDISS